MPQMQSAPPMDGMPPEFQDMLPPDFDPEMPLLPALPALD
jgi:hypothetical protein